MSHTYHLTAFTCKTIISNVVDHYWFKAAISLFACWFNWLYGTEKEALFILICLIIFDTILGVIKSAKTGDLNTPEFCRVAVKVCVYFILVATGNLVDRVLPIKAAATMIESFLAITEGLSILENSCQIGIPVPKNLVKFLKVMKDNKEEETKEKP